MNDKNSMTLNEMFGEKSAAFGEGARRLTDDELFEFATFLLPVGRVKKLKQAGSRGVKVVRDILDELMGKGKKVSGEVPVSKDPFRLLPKKQDPGLTMRDILEGNKRAMDVPAFEREALGLTKRVRVPGKKQNVETGQQSINEILRIEAPSSVNPPALRRQMVPRAKEQRMEDFLVDLLDRTGNPSGFYRNPMTGLNYGPSSALQRMANRVNKMKRELNDDPFVYRDELEAFNRKAKDLLNKYGMRKRKVYK